MIMEKAYAKLNLSLKVIGKMDNGFHEIESIMVPICDLYDELYFEENDSYDFIVDVDGGFDVRKPLFNVLAAKNMPILMLTSTKMSLEDVFIELTKGGNK
jgi:4-diphosphocytidyl-2C-methyl-D-erythritol kinase